MSELTLLLFITIMASATFATRAIPFLFLHRFSEHPVLERVARFAPAVIMTILVVYSIKSYDYTTISGYAIIPGIAVTALMHFWWRNVLLSIITGTVTYILLIHI